jgi:CHAT domain-containing protein
VFALTSKSLAHERVRDGADTASVANDQLLDAIGVRAGQMQRLPQKRDFARKDRPPDQTSDPQLVNGALATLSNTLLPGDVARLLTSENIAHIVIVPTRDLGTIPYPLLQVPEVGQLVDRVSITIAPSAGDVLRHCRVRRGIARPLVIGNPLFADPEYDLAPLPGAEQEAVSIGVLVGTNPLIGASATKAEVRTASGSADLIYLATHGVAHEEDPLDQSFIALAPSDKADTRWTAREIQHEELAAELVVLSACQTGLGGSLDGGTVGLARAFQIAGARQVIMTLWSIDDLASATLMREIMTRHLAGEPVPESVRTVMASAKENGLPPILWAPFTTFAGQFKFG